MRNLCVALSALLLAATGASALTYTTFFSLTENPISEGGFWLNGRADGLDWYNVQTTPGKAFGEPSPATPKYGDPTAILKGSWGPNQIVTATVFSVNPTASYYQEVEIRLRHTVAAHSITGYEVLWRCLTDGNGYVGVVKWNGPFASWTSIGSLSGAGYGVTNGDTVKATISGTVISVYKNGYLQMTVNDTSFKSGNPGMGFNYGVGPTNGDFGFSSFSATDGATLERDEVSAVRLHRNTAKQRLVISRNSHAGVYVRINAGKNTGIFDLFGRNATCARTNGFTGQ